MFCKTEVHSIDMAEIERLALASIHGKTILQSMAPRKPLSCGASDQPRRYRQACQGRESESVRKLRKPWRRIKRTGKPIARRGSQLIFPQHLSRSSLYRTWL